MTQSKLELVLCVLSGTTQGQGLERIKSFMSSLDIKTENRTGAQSVKHTFNPSLQWSMCHYSSMPESVIFVHKYNIQNLTE